MLHRLGLRGLIGFIGLLAAPYVCGPAVAASFYGSHAPIQAPNTWGLLEFNKPLTGATTRIGAGGLMFDSDFNAAGVLYSSDGDHLNTVNLATGERTRAGTYDDNGLISSIAFAPSGALYGIRQNFLVTIDPATAHVTRIGITTDPIFSIDFAPDGTLYGAGSGGIFTIDPATAQTTSLVAADPPFVFEGLDFGIDGVLRGVGRRLSPVNQGELHEIDVAAGTIHLVGITTEAAMESIASIPEPSTGILLVLASALVRRRKPGAVGVVAGPAARFG